MRAFSVVRGQVEWLRYCRKALYFGAFRRVARAACRVSVSPF